MERTCMEEISTRNFAGHNVSSIPQYDAGLSSHVHGWKKVIAGPGWNAEGLWGSNKRCQQKLHGEASVAKYVHAKSTVIFVWAKRNQQHQHRYCQNRQNHGLNARELTITGRNDCHQKTKQQWHSNPELPEFSERRACDFSRFGWNLVELQTSPEKNGHQAEKSRNKNQAVISGTFTFHRSVNKNHFVAIVNILALD